MLRWLAGFALARGTVLTSLMVKLHCASLVERSLIPAFIFFFQMLYPFAWVNDPRRSTAAAAGGCMLIRMRRRCAEAGGIETITDALIDDCALARLMKLRGPIWLGLTERVVSIRHYPQWRDVAGMVTRSAYAQLCYSPLLLAATVIGAMAVVFLAPPIGTAVARLARMSFALFGLAAWAVDGGDAVQADAAALRSVGACRALAPPAIAVRHYLLFTIDYGPAVDARNAPAIGRAASRPAKAK